MSLQALHCKKRLMIFPSPAGMSLTNSPWRGIMYYAVWYLVGDGKIANFFYSVGKSSTLELIVPLISISLGINSSGNHWQLVPVSLLSSSLRISFSVSVEMYPMHSCKKMILIQLKTLFWRESTSEPLKNRWQKNNTVVAGGKSGKHPLRNLQPAQCEICVIVLSL